MKLSEYFHQQKSQAMTSQMKSQIFSRVQKEKLIGTQTPATLSSKRFLFASKKIMYTSLTAVLVLAVFGGVLLDKNDVIDFGFFSIQQQNPNGVLADYVADIVEFNGEYSLMHDGQILSDSHNLHIISDGDVVTLSTGTELVFTLTDGTQARIVGPAEFYITKQKKGYQIYLMDGKFFRIYCPDCASDIEIITPDAVIHQEKNQILDVHIAREEDGEMLVKNDGDTVTVTSTKAESETSTELEPTELVAIALDSDSMNVFSDSDLMSLFMAKNNISSTFTLSTDEVEWPKISRPSNDILAMNTTENIDSETTKSDYTDNSTISEDDSKISDNVISILEDPDPILAGIMDVISSDVVITGMVDNALSSELGFTTDSKQVPTENQMQTIKSNLNSFFLLNLFESIYTADKVDENITKLAERINAVAGGFGYSDRANSDLSSIKNLSKLLSEKIEQDWYISPSYILQLEKVARRCDELLSHSDVAGDTLSQQRSSLQSNLPTYLRLM